MRKFVGVIDPWLLDNNNNGIDTARLKQHALLFDYLAIPLLQDVFLKDNRIRNDNILLTEIEWLIENGIILDSQIVGHTEPSSPEYEEEKDGVIRHSLGMVGAMAGLDPQKLLGLTDDDVSEISDAEDDVPEISDAEIDDFIEKIKKLVEALKRGDKKLSELPEVINQIRLMTLHQTRMFSIRLRENEGLDAHPVLSTSISLNSETQAARSDVLQIVLNILPVPDYSTPWEHILEYRSDPDSFARFLDLRVWMSEVARAKLTPVEVEEKLEDLMSQYQRHMKLHRMKTNTGTLETIITTGAEVLGDLVSFKWGKAAQVLFALKRRQVALLEGELTAPGNEVAYIVKAREFFKTE